MSRPGRPYTHIVVGAGAAGAILAARLSEDEAARVLLIEAGGRGRDPLLGVPIMTGLLLRGSRHAWRFTTEPSPGLDGRRSDWPRGRVLGGSTAINGMVHVRGLARDYDLWAQSGLADWSWERVRPWFLKSEDFRGPGGLAEHHASGGPLAVSRRARPVSPLAEAFVAAGVEAGYPALDDFSAPEAEGFGYYHFAIRDGRRESTATAFLARARPNLAILTGREVIRVEIESGRARAVLARGPSGPERHFAEAEIVLSAGTIGSPKILMLSGIGPADHLAGLGLPVHVDAPEVGANLHDHILVRVQHRAREDATLHRLTRIDRAALAFLRALLFGTGPMNVFPIEAGGFVRSPGASLPDLQTAFLPALSSATVRLNPFARLATDAAPGFMANVSVMRPLSRGDIRLASADPFAPPRIRPNYLAERHDLDRLVDGLAMLREVFSQNAFDRWRGPEISPGPDIRSPKAIERWIRRTADTVFHPVGTCRMGADARSVVDGALRVRGVDGLRVADASVFPSIPSANTAAPSMMVGEKAAGLVLGRHG